MAWCPAVMRLGDDCKSLGNHRDSQLSGALLYQVFVAAERRRGLENAVRQVWQTLTCSSDPDKTLYPVVIRCHVLVVDGPVVTRTIEAVSLEVVRRKPERLAPPNVRAPADEARAIPVELLPVSHGVWLAR